MLSERQSRDPGNRVVGLACSALCRARPAEPSWTELRLISSPSRTRFDRTGGLRGHQVRPRGPRQAALHLGAPNEAVALTFRQASSV